MARKRVFLSFDCDNDQILKNFVLRQSVSGTVPFEVIGCSQKRNHPVTAWDHRTRRDVTRAHAVVVMVGSFTHRCACVAKEVQMAKEAGTPVVQIVGHKGSEPEGLNGAGRLFTWTPQNIENLFN